MHALSKIRAILAPRPVPLLASEKPEKLMRYPELSQRDVQNAALFATRHDQVKHFAPSLKGGTIAELGVMYGDFSEFILDTCEPNLFVGIDLFQMHKISHIWNKSSALTFRGKTHREFYEGRFRNRGDQVRCEEGDTNEVLARYPDRTFDMIYIDAGHDYDSVRRDAQMSKQKIKENGILIFNDYIRFSHYDDSYYGVIPVVNELVVKQAFEIIGFALQADMYCDVAIRRR